MFNFTDAGNHAPPGVKDEIKKYQQLPEEIRRKKPLLYHLLGEGTPAYKYNHEDSDYTDHSPLENQSCKTCEYMYLKEYKNKHICSWVRGTIQPEGWCVYWQSHKGHGHGTV